MPAPALAALLLACSNELSLFCPGKAGRSAQRCLALYEESATPRCRAALSKFPPSRRKQRPFGWAAAGAPPSAAGALSAAVSSADPAPGFGLDVRSSRKFYALSGKTPRELSAAMNASGLSDSIDGGAAAAVTAGAIDLSYSLKNEAGACRLASAHVSVRVVETLPKWAAPTGAPAKTAAWWAKASAAISAHENGHKARWISAGQDALTFLKEMQPLPGCAAMDQAVRAEADAANTAALQAQVAWDKDTAHGKTQWQAAFGR